MTTPRDGAGMSATLPTPPAAGGTLRQAIQNAAGAAGLSMTDLTVLAVQNDPYRVDTPAGQRDGEWFAEQFNAVIGGRASLHLRGVHYGIISRDAVVLKPNGKPYRNTDEDWSWLQNTASKAARWLGYVPFESITDQRNDPPVVRAMDRPALRPLIEVGVYAEIPDVDDLQPTVAVNGFTGRQPYRLVIWGEKSSLREVLNPIAERYEADLYLPTGEISDTLMYQMAKDAAEDGRPMRVFTVADCDPAGHQMPVSVGRKLQALRDLYFHDLDFEVRSVALTVEQVRELRLPSTPLKESELRADRWRAAFGVGQTEVDALATLQPRVLDRIVRQAVRPFYDMTLDDRVAAERGRWLQEAQTALDARCDTEFLVAIREQAAERLTTMKAEIDELNRSLDQAVPDDLSLPNISIPEPVISTGLHGKPLISSSWAWADQTRALIERKSYGGAT
jgi:hypothetical protein